MLALPAAAFEPGDIILRGGVGLIFPNDSNSLTGLPGATVGVDDAVAFAFTAGYMPTDHFAVELLGIWPANHDIEGGGILPGLGIRNVATSTSFRQPCPLTTPSSRRNA
ncbi:MAG: OmpW family outer membrane protein [Gammaproteobacteria bacterium]|jgi:outer membrane protein